MGYRMSGIVTFEFHNLETDDLDAYEARHYAESLGLETLLDYSDGEVIVTVERQEVI